MAHGRVRYAVTATENQMKARQSAAPPTPAPVPADEQPGELLSGRYRLGARIGSGGMADVYEGVDTRLRRSVAVKVFRPGPDPQTEDRLTAEAVLLARLQHPGLVTVYDAGRHDDRTYLVMQLIEGPTLRSILASGALPERRVVEVGAALARVLAYVHQSGVVHRDIKPSNILLDTAGAPHLADFGIARLADATRHTAPDVLIGTAAYLAPEQVRGRQIGPAADVYALGLVLLECLKGELEYQGTPLEATVARLHRPPDVPAWLAPELAALLRAMTAQDPEARPDAEHCAQALASRHTGPAPYPLPLPAPSEPGLPTPPATHPGAKERIRSQEAVVTRRSLTGGTRHGRRLAAGTALALSVALGATLAATSSTSESADRKAATPATTPANPPSGTATAKSPPGALPPTRSHGSQPSSGTSGGSDAAAATTGSHAQPVSRTLGASDPAAAPGSSRGTSAPPTSPRPTGSTSPSAPTETGATGPSRTTPPASPTTGTATPSPRPSKSKATTGAPPKPTPTR
ncbi:protein kinase domain-containing protein [Streptomyces griseosporeus]|uniref:protein kinase domain-containing protein n=1 Tax=Streptomyces griseosporeus TaxID=1910 RepID=UPI0036F85F64